MKVEGFLPSDSTCSSNDLQFIPYKITIENEREHNAFSNLLNIVCDVSSTYKDSSYFIVELLNKCPQLEKSVNFKEKRKL